LAEPEHIDEALVRRLIAGQFPQWAGLPVAPVAKPGWDNMTFRVGDALSVRMPRFARWIGQVEREQRWLPVLAPQLPLAVPEPVGRGEPAEGYPYPWSVYRWLEGEPVDPQRLADPEAAAIALARFLRALREIDAAGGPPPEWSNGYRGGPIGDERDSPIVETRVRPKLDALAGVIDVGPITAVWEAAHAAPAWDRPPVWVHGDPAPSNLLAVDGRLSAVIDFGTLAVGDPAVDLIAAWQSLPAGARDAFRAELGVDDATWARGRGWGLAAVLPDPEALADPARAAHARRPLDELVSDLERTG
jgi:aminoglycoside phosphotransferase (APT) family kinase protein